ncbi:MAG: hypothetical protein IPH99_09960 [Xanthomonadales bacterium]|nr:hypothetical protein [Xanthomonadales bacterium]
MHADAAEINHDQGGQNLRKDAQSPIEIVFVIEQADDHQQGGSTEESAQRCMDRRQGQHRCQHKTGQHRHAAGHGGWFSVILAPCRMIQQIETGRDGNQQFLHDQRYQKRNDCAPQSRQLKIHEFLLPAFPVARWYPISWEKCACSWLSQSQRVGIDETSLQGRSIFADDSYGQMIRMET